MGAIDTNSKISKVGTVVDDNVAYATSSAAKFSEVPVEIWGNVFSHGLDAPFVPAIKNTHQLALAHPRLSAALKTSGQHRNQVELLKTRIALVGAICDAVPKTESDKNRVSLVLPLYRLLTRSQQQTIDTYLKKLANIPQELSLISLDYYTLHSMTDPTRVWMAHVVREATSMSSRERLLILETCAQAGIDNCIVDPDWLNWMDATDRSNFVKDALTNEKYFTYLLQATPSSLSNEEFLLIADYAVRNHLTKEELFYLPQFYFDMILDFFRSNISRIDAETSHRIREGAIEKITFRGLSIICLMMHQSLIKDIEQEDELIQIVVSNFLDLKLDLRYLSDVAAWSESLKSKFFSLVASKFDDTNYHGNIKVSWIEQIAVFWKDIPLASKEELQAAISRYNWAEDLSTRFVEFTYDLWCRKGVSKLPKEMWKILTEQVRPLYAGMISQTQTKARFYVGDDIDEFDTIDFLTVLERTINFLSQEERIKLLKVAARRFGTQGFGVDESIMDLCIRSLISSDPEMLSTDASFRKIFGSSKRAAEGLLKLAHFVSQDDAEVVFKLTLCLAEDEPDSAYECLSLLACSQKAPRIFRARLATFLVGFLKKKSVKFTNFLSYKDMITLANDDSFWA